MSDTILERFPNIARAAMFLSDANNGLSQKANEQRAMKVLPEILGAEGVYEKDLRWMDEFISTLGKEDFENLLDGDIEDMKQVAARCKDPDKLHGLLDDLYYQVDQAAWLAGRPCSTIAKP